MSRQRNPRFAALIVLLALASIGAGVMCAYPSEGEMVIIADAPTEQEKKSAEVEPDEHAVLRVMDSIHAYNKKLDEAAGERP